jgi:glycine/D-amino acid oxidase-like deaminating enzyme
MLVRQISQSLALLALAVNQGSNSQQTQVIFGTSNEEQFASSSFTPPTYQRAKKIAILGAGPGGTSTAYFLSKAQEKLQSLGRGGEGFELTLFERDERIGGRTAIIHPYFDEKLPAVELGASIFADVNRNLKRAAEVSQSSRDACPPVFAYRNIRSYRTSISRRTQSWAKRAL